MTEELNKVIMTQSRLHNKYLKEKSGESKITYQKTTKLQYESPT